MTEKTLPKYIQQLNKAADLNGIFRRAVSPAVDYTVVWDKLPDPRLKYRPTPRPYYFYFIKNESGQYLAAVLDMENDLHSYVMPEHRKNGHLGRALFNTILPHLFTKRDTVRVTVDFGDLKPVMAKRSEHVTIKMGFSQVKPEGSKKVFELNRQSFLGPVFKEESASFVPADKIDAVVYPLFHATHLLSFAQTGFEAVAGVNHLSMDLAYMSQEIEMLARRIYDYSGSGDV